MGSYEPLTLTPGETLTAAEAAEAAGVSIKTILRRIADGELKAHRNGTARNSSYVISGDALTAVFPYRKKAS